MSEKKLVRRNIAIGLGIFCIILIAGTSGVIVYYEMALTNNSVLYNDYVLGHSYTNYEYSALNTSLNKARSEVNDLESTLQLQKVQVYSYENVEIPAVFSTEPEIGEYFLSGDPSFGRFAGVAYIQISSNRNETYVNVTYSAENLQFDYNSQTDIGTEGMVSFPVLPTSLINIRVLTHSDRFNVIWGKANVTVTYRY